LASVPALRRGRGRLVRLACLLASMLSVAFVMPVVAFVASGILAAVILPAPGHWSPVPGPPAKAIALVKSPRCLDLVVQTEGGRLFGYRAGQWTAVGSPARFG
jgi:hypothetical protein